MSGCIRRPWTWGTCLILVGSMLANPAVTQAKGLCRPGRHAQAPAAVRYGSPYIVQLPVGMGTVSPTPASTAGLEAILVPFGMEIVRKILDDVISGHQPGVDPNPPTGNQVEFSCDLFDTEGTDEDEAITESRKLLIDINKKLKLKDSEPKERKRGSKKKPKPPQEAPPVAPAGVINHCT